MIKKAINASMLTAEVRQMPKPKMAPQGRAVALYRASDLTAMSSYITGPSCMCIWFVSHPARSSWPPNKSPAGSGDQRQGEYGKYRNRYGVPFGPVGHNSVDESQHYCLRFLKGLRTQMQNSKKLNEHLDERLNFRK